MRVLFVCVLVNVCYVYSTIVKHPKNTAIFAGDRMELECRTNYSVREWSYSRKGNSSIQVILSNYNREEGVRIRDPAFGADVNKNGSGLIYLNRTQLEHGGNYSCAIKSSSFDLHYAQLTVIESPPKCNVVKNNSNHIRIKCSINYTGNWAPRMNCSLPIDMFLEIIQFNAIDFIKIKNSDTSGIISTLDTHLNVTGISFIVSCNIFFENLENQSSKYASNIPDFYYVWKSSTYNFNNRASEETNPPQKPTTNADDSSTSWISSSSGMLIAVILMAIIGTSCFFIGCKIGKTTGSDQKSSPIKYTNGEALDEQVAEYDDINVSMNPITQSKSKVPKDRIIEENSSTDYMEIIEDKQYEALKERGSSESNSRIQRNNFAEDAAVYTKLAL